MATNYPGSIDNGTSLPYPTSGNFTNGPSLAGGQDNQNDAIIATQTKLGTGASTPTNLQLLIGTGAGSSAWSKTAPAGAIVGTTDTQTLTNKTFTSPTINSPVITNANITTDIITGFTSANSGTVFGIAIASGAITGANTVNGSSLMTASVPGSALVAGSVPGTALANGAVNTTQLADGAVTPAKLFAGNGTSWPSQTWTPTFVNISGGTLVQSKYFIIGKLVYYRIKYVFAGAGMGTAPTFTLPVTAASDYNADTDHVIGLIEMVKAGTQRYKGTIFPASTTVGKLFIDTITGSNVIDTSNPSATAPFTWASGDYFICYGFYEAA